MQISDDQFEELIGQALDSLPPKYTERLLRDVVVIWADDPSQEQRRQLRLRSGQSLFGLYEGLPLPQRYSGGTKLTPDKITLFKNPILSACRDLTELREHIRHTLWHEMAHYFGLDHPRIRELE